MKNEAVMRREPVPRYEMLEEMFRQKDEKEAEKKPRQLKFSLPIRKKGRHEL